MDDRLNSLDRLNQLGRLNQLNRLNPLDRRQFLGGMLGAFLLTGCGRSGGAGHSLNILSWADYLHPDTIPEFEKRYSVKVIYDTFASNEALLSKLQAGGTKYDIIVPSSYMVKQLKKLDILSEIDHERVKLFANLMERFQNPSFDPGLKHCIPYTWGTTGLGFNRKVLGEKGFSFGKERLSWEVFWDKRLSQRMTLLDDGREVIGMSLKRHGHSYNTTDEEKMRPAIDDLKVQKPLTMCYTSDQVIVELSSGDSYLSQVFSGDAFQARRSNSDVAYHIPKEGASIWSDNFCIPRTAPHPDNAYLWLNYLLEKEVASACANFTHYATANAAAFPLVDSELKDDPNLYPPESVLSTCEDLKDIGAAVFTYDRLWTELKCS